MTAEERAAKVGCVVATYPDDALAEVYRSEIAAAVRAAVLEEREACATMADAQAEECRLRLRHAESGALWRFAALVRERPGP